MHALDESFESLRSPLALSMLHIDREHRTLMVAWSLYFTLFLIGIRKAREKQFSVSRFSWGLA